MDTMYYCCFIFHDLGRSLLSMKMAFLNANCLLVNEIDL